MRQGEQAGNCCSTAQVRQAVGPETWVESGLCLGGVTIKLVSGLDVRLKEAQEEGRLLGLGLRPRVDGGIPPQTKDYRRYRCGVYWRNQVGSRIHSWDLSDFLGLLSSSRVAQNHGEQRGHTVSQF